MADANALTLRIITPEGVALDTTCEHVSFPTLDGSVGVLRGHAPLVAGIGTGELAYRGSFGDGGMFVAGGFAEVRDDTVRLVTDASEPPDAIDLERAAEEAERARKQLDELQATPGESADFLRAQAALRRALLRQRIAEKYRVR